MREKKLNINTQLFLESVPWLFVFIIILIDNLNFFSTTIESFLGIISWIIIIITLRFKVKKKEKIDELANILLGKVNDICIKILIGLLVVFAIFMRLASFSYTILSLDTISNILILMIFGIMTLKSLLFSYYDRKGI